MCSSPRPTAISSRPAARPCAVNPSSTRRSTALIRDYPERAKAGEAAQVDILTPRESEIVKLVAEGHSSKEIADTLVISVKTVERHRSNVLEKLGIRDRLELTRYAIRQGLIEP